MKLRTRRPPESVTHRGVVITPVPASRRWSAWWSMDGVKKTMINDTRDFPGEAIDAAKLRIDVALDGEKRVARTRR